MPPDDTPATLLASIDAERHRLRDLLAGMDEAALAQRPPNGKWSVLENVRHLLFAEQVHLGGFTPDGRWRRSLALPSPEMRQARQILAVDGTPLSTVAAALQAWETVHTPRRAVAHLDTAEVHKALTGNLRHLRHHIEIIERLLRAAARSSSRSGTPAG